MDEKSVYYDGSIQNYEFSDYEPLANEPFVLTDEMRKNISGNPFIME